MVLVSWNGTDLDLTFSDHSKVYGQEQLEARSKDGMVLGRDAPSRIISPSKKLVSAKSFGCGFEGCAIFQGGRFQSEDFNNKSVNLFRAAHRLPPC